MEVVDPHSYAQCDACPLAGSKATRGVCPSAPPKRVGKSGTLMLVGEGPGYNEIIQKAPFVGRSGQLLSALLKAAGIDRDECYIANATSCLPPKQDTAGGDAKSLMESFASSVHRCLPRLEYEIAQVRPRVIVGLGNAALTALTGEEKVKTKRVKRPCATCGTKFEKKCPECGGKKTVVVEETVVSTPHTISWVAGMVIAPPADGWLASYGVRYVVPTYHPSYLLRKAETDAQRAIGGQFAAPAVVAHLAKAARLMRSEPRWKMTHTVTRDAAVLAAYIADPRAPFAIDIETDNQEWASVTSILCIGIGRVDRDEVLVVDTTEASPALLDELRRFLASRAHQKILQNRSYDEACIDRVWGCVVRGTVGDTLLQHHALWSDELHDLHRIGARYTDVPPWKPAKKSRGREVFASMEEFWLYNARDVRVTGLSSVAMDAEIREERVGAVYEMDMKMSDIAIDMQLAGVAFDATELQKLGAEKGAKADEALQAIRAEVTIPEALWVKDKKRADRHLFNPHSVPQLRWMLYGADGPCKLHAPKKTDKGFDATSKEALRWLMHPLVEQLKAYRGAQKVVSTIQNYVDYLKPDGRLYPSWRPFGARSGRWSSSPNLQNVDPIIRAAIIAPPGCKIVGADESQLELRILAGLCGDEKLINLCANADESRKLDPENDPHSYVAALAFGRTFMEADAKGRKILRDIAKRVVYALNYGAGAAKIADNIMSDEDYSGPPVRVDMVQRVVLAYFKGFPGVPTWRDEQIKTAARTRETRSAVLGRRRSFPLGDADATIVYNHPIQATAADLVDEMMLAVYGGLEDVAPGAAIVMQVHDAIYIECRDEHVDAVKHLMESSMNFSRRLSPSGPEMPFAAKAKSAQSWAELG